MVDHPKGGNPKSVTQMSKSRKNKTTKIRNLKTKDKLRSSETLLAATQPFIGDGVISCAPDAIVIELNTAAERVTGWSTTEAKGLPIAKVFKIAHATTGEKLENPVKRTLKDGVTVDLANDTMLIARDGTEYQIAGSCSPIKGTDSDIIGIGLVLRDVTKEYLQRKALKESEERYRTVFESSMDANLLLDLEKGYLSCNRAAVNLFAADSEELLLQQTPSSLSPIHQGDGTLSAEKALQMIETTLEKGSHLFEWTHKRLNGEEFVAGVLMTRMELNGRTILHGIIRDITEQKQAEEELSFSESRYRTLVENAPEAICVIDLDTGQWIDVNENASKIFGVSREELLQIGPADVSPPFQPDGKPSLESALEYCEKAFAGYPQYFEWTHINLKTNQRFPCDLRLVKLPSSTRRLVRGSVIDITERKLAARKLEKSEEKYRSILETMEEGYFEVDLAGTFTLVNESMAKIMDYSKAELLGMNNREYMSKETAVRIFEIFNTVYRTGKPHKGFTYELIRNDGQTRTIEVSTTLRLDNEGTPCGFSGVGRDITEQKRSREVMIQTEKMLLVGGLAAGMAHEINNPLGGMLQGVQNIQRRLSPDFKANLKLAEELGFDLQKLQAYLDQRGVFSMLQGVRDSGIKAAQIITDMLRFSRKSESRFAPINLVSLMEKVIDLAGKDYNLKKKYDFRNIAIIREFEKDLPLVPCSETEIEQVILNLLNNAAWAMANDSDCELPQIILRLSVNKERVRIEIEDNGPGMNEDAMKHLFEPFYTTKPVGQGTGLGLSVSYMIITNNHKGSLEVSSATGKGARFTIQLPLEVG